MGTTDNVDDLAELLDISIEDAEQLDAHDIDAEIVQTFGKLEGLFEAMNEERYPPSVHTDPRAKTAGELSQKINDLRKRLTFDAENVTSKEIKGLCREIRSQMNVSREEQSK